MMKTYKIERMYRDHDKIDLVASGLTLAQVQKHCQNPETSSRTCTNEEGIRRTEEYGPWFDGYSEDNGEESAKVLRNTLLKLDGK